MDQLKAQLTKQKEREKQMRKRAGMLFLRVLDKKNNFQINNNEDGNQFLVDPLQNFRFSDDEAVIEMLKAL